MKSTNHRRVPVALVSIATHATSYWAGGRISSVNWNLTPIFPDLVVFLLDKKTQDAVIRNFGIIGEACNNVTKHHGPFAAAHPQAPWNFAYEMRNALSHGYFKVDQQIVWQTIGDDLPGLRQAVQAAKMSTKQ